MRMMRLIAAVALMAGLGIALPATAAPTGSGDDPDVECFEDDDGDWICHDVKDLAEDCAFTDPKGVGEECAWVNSQTKKTRPGHAIYQGRKNLTTQQPGRRTKTFVPQRTRAKRIKTHRSLRRN